MLEELTDAATPTGRRSTTVHPCLFRSIRNPPLSRHMIDWAVMPGQDTQVRRTITPMRLDLYIRNKRENVRRLAEQDVKGPVVKVDDRSARSSSSPRQRQVQTIIDLSSPA